MLKRTRPRQVVTAALIAGSLARAAHADPCMDYWTAEYKCAQGCGPCAGGNSQTQEPSREEQDRQQRLRDEEEARARRLREALVANEAGVEACKVLDWTKAVALFQVATEKNPDDVTMRGNLAYAQKQLSIEQKDKAAGANLQGGLKEFSKSLGQGASSTAGPDFDQRDSGNSGNGSGLDFVLPPSPSSSPSKSPSGKAKAKTAPHGDPMVVDARNVPSGLPKAMDEAIADVYRDAPAAVSDRVRKGFQAVMERDWKVAKAWFADALQRDPSNAGLKRLVAISDSASAKPSPAKPPAKLTWTPAKSTWTKRDWNVFFATGKEPLDGVLTNGTASRLPGIEDLLEVPEFERRPDGTVIQLPAEDDTKKLLFNEAPKQP